MIAKTPNGTNSTLAVVNSNNAIRMSTSTNVDALTEISTRTVEVQKADREMLERLRRWGRLVPFAFLRRAMLRSMFGSPARRRKMAGTFQVSVVPADWALSSAFVATGVLIAGAVRGRPRSGRGRRN